MSDFKAKGKEGEEKKGQGRVGPPIRESGSASGFPGPFYVRFPGLSRTTEPT